MHNATLWQLALGLAALSGAACATAYHGRRPLNDYNTVYSYNMKSNNCSCDYNTTQNTVWEIEQHGVRVRFQAPVMAGQFATKDWWVLGPATVVETFPASSAGRHGLQLNPAVASSQALDDRIQGYDASLAATLPLVVQPGDALVKAVSVPKGEMDRSALQVAVVITIVINAPASDAFRPPYFGTRATRRSLPEFRTGGLQLGLLPDAVVATAGVPPDAWMLGRFERPQLDWLQGWGSRAMHPVDAMPDYGADILRDAGDAALKLLTPTEAPKTELAIGFIQWGIDCYGIVLGGGSWPANGGHANGRKLPMTYAAVLLRDDAMADTVRGAAAACLASGGVECTFSEDSQLVRAPAHAAHPLWGHAAVSERGYWELLTDPNCNGNRIAADPYGWIDGGPIPGTEYQFCCVSAPWKGTALALLLWDEARAVFNNDDFSSYTRRWVDQGAWAQPDPCAPPSGSCSDGSGPCTGSCHGTPCGAGENGTCILSMAGYGTEFGPDGHGGCIQDSDQLDGVGRFPAAHGSNADGGYYGSSFQKSMWTGEALRACGAAAASPALQPTPLPPAPVCSWVVGDAVGGSEVPLGEVASKEECAALVRCSQPSANGATYPASDSSSNSTCYAEFRANDRNGDTGYQSCLFGA